MKFILNNFEAVFTIVVILIAIVSSMFNKKNRPQDTEDGDNAPSAPPARTTAQRTQTQPQPRRQPASIDEEMRKTLDDIFSAKQPAPRENQRQQPAGDSRKDSSSFDSRKQPTAYEKRKTVVPATRASAQPQANRKVVVKPGADDVEWMRAMEAMEGKDAARGAAKASARVLATTAVAEEPAPTFTLFDCEHSAAEQARSGVIWSEILQPPVSMR